MVVVKPVSSTDEINSVADLAAEIWTEYWPAIIGRDQTDYMINTFQSPPAISQQITEGYQYFVATEGLELKGYCAVLASGKRMMISKLYVRASSRGKGVGTALLDKIKETAQQAGCDILWLVVNRKNALAIAVYEAMGFIRSGSQIKEIGQGYVMDDYIYEFPLRVG